MERKKTFFFPFLSIVSVQPLAFLFLAKYKKKKREKKKALYLMSEKRTNKHALGSSLFFLYMTISGRLKESGSGSLISPFSPPFASFRAHFPPRPAVPTHSEFSRRFHRDPPKPPRTPPPQLNHHHLPHPTAAVVSCLDVEKFTRT